MQVERHCKCNISSDHLHFILFIRISFHSQVIVEMRLFDKELSEKLASTNYVLETGD
jgi:hypothetical protein